MVEENKVDEEETVTLEEPAPEAEASENPEEETSETPTEDEAEADSSPVVSFGDDEGTKEEAEKQTPLMRDLRKQLREQTRENRKLRKAQETKADELPELGPEPKLADYDYDEGKLIIAIREHDAKKRAHDSKADEVKKASDDQRAAWSGRFEEYNGAKEQYSSGVVDEAEATVMEAMSDQQQGAMIHALGAEAANLVVGLGASPERLKKLSSIKDPTLFAFELGKQASAMKVTPPRKPNTSPEKRVTGSAPARSGDTTLETLRADAQESGNYSKVIAHKRALKAS